MIMATGGLLGARLIEVGVITLLDIHLLAEDQEGTGPGHILLDTVLKGTMHVVLGEMYHQSNCSCFSKWLELSSRLNHVWFRLRDALQLWFDALLSVIIVCSTYSTVAVFIICAALLWNEWITGLWVFALFVFWRGPFELVNDWISSI